MCLAYVIINGRSDQSSLSSFSHCLLHTCSTPKVAFIYFFSQGRHCFRAIEISNRHFVCSCTHPHPYPETITCIDTVVQPLHNSQSVLLTIQAI
jgi:hypothetical protein